MKKVAARGPLVADGMSPDDVNQGIIADCYAAAPAAAMADADPERLRRSIQVARRTPEGDTLYRVKFYRKIAPGHYEKELVFVDGDLYVYEVMPGTTALAYGGPVRWGGVDVDRVEMWFPVLEKAYAAWVAKSYDGIGQGGWPATFLQAMYGRDAHTLAVTSANAGNVWEVMRSLRQAGRPIVADTPDSKTPLRDGLRTGIAPWHVYSVHGVRVGEDGTRYVELRNPWGFAEPGILGWVTIGDGEFLMPLDEFSRRFEGIAFA